MTLKKPSTGRVRCGELGKDRLLQHLLSKIPRKSSVVMGAGDDCAVVEGPRRGRVQLLKTDCVVEGIHFTSKTPPAEIGWKAMAGPLSNFAAMAGVPQFALVTLIVPAERTLDWMRKIYHGLDRK